jgi:hypothetical protein
MNHISHDHSESIIIIIIVGVFYYRRVYSCIIASEKEMDACVVLSINISSDR